MYQTLYDIYQLQHSSSSNQEIAPVMGTFLFSGVYSQIKDFWLLDFNLICFTFSLSLWLALFCLHTTLSAQIPFKCTFKASSAKMEI